MAGASFRSPRLAVSDVEHSDAASMAAATINRRQVRRAATFARHSRREAVVLSQHPMPAPRVTRKSIVNFVGVLALAASPFWLYALLFPEGYAYVAGIFVLFAALLVNIALIIHVSRQDAELRHIMLVGLFVKLMGAAAYLTVMLHYYHGGDMFGYF